MAELSADENLGRRAAENNQPRRPPAYVKDKAAWLRAYDESGAGRHAEMVAFIRDTFARHRDGVLSFDKLESLFITELPEFLNP